LRGQIRTVKLAGLSCSRKRGKESDAALSLAGKRFEERIETETAQPTLLNRVGFAFVLMVLAAVVFNAVSVVSAVADSGDKAVAHRDSGPGSGDDDDHSGPGGGGDDDDDDTGANTAGTTVGTGASQTATNDTATGTRTGHGDPNGHRGHGHGGDGDTADTATGTTQGTGASNTATNDTATGTRTRAR
jgi:hypothetical protein